MKKNSNQVLFLVGKTDAMYAHQQEHRSYRLQNLAIVAPRAYPRYLVGFRLELGLTSAWWQPEIVIMTHCESQDYGLT
jgi:hypothetical protein